MVLWVPDPKMVVYMDPLGLCRNQNPTSEEYEPFYTAIL